MFEHFGDVDMLAISVDHHVLGLAANTDDIRQTPLLYADPVDIKQ